MLTMSSDQPTKSVFLYSSQLDQYSYPDDNPFKTQRTSKTREILLAHDMLSGQGRSEQSFQPAERDTLEKFHTPEYLDAMIAAQAGKMGVEGLEMGLATADCPVFRGMYEYAALACGATLRGAELILSGQSDVAFNTSGGYHHAGPGFAAGFCYMNDVALACLVLAEQGKRVLFLDVDVHHGDGVQNAFYDRSDVMTISFHQDGKTIFPGTGFADEIGEGEGLGFCVNVPLPPGTYDQVYMEAFDAIAPPLVKAYKPDVIVLELGMDGLASDPLGALNLTNNTYADIVKTVVGLQVPILATGGGGYHPVNTARGWALAWGIMSGDQGIACDAYGMGGVMLETTDWQEGLRDRVLIPDHRTQEAIYKTVQATIETVKDNVFSIHGLQSANTGDSTPGSDNQNS